MIPTTDYDLQNEATANELVFQERAVEGVTPWATMDRCYDRYNFVREFVPGKAVLDIACGSGYGTRMMKDAGATSAVGLDLSDEAVVFAKTHYGTEGLEFHQGDACRFDLGRRFGVIVSFETIEHVPDVAGFLESVKRHMEPDGTFIVSTPWSTPGFDKPQNPHHLIEWSLTEFEALLNGHFSTVRMLVQDPYIRIHLMGLRITRRIPRFFLRRRAAMKDPTWTQHSYLRGIYDPATTENFWMAGRSDTIIGICRLS